MKTILFFRNLNQFTGGHLKVYDYFNHVLASPTHRAKIYFSKPSIWDRRNPWHEDRTHVVPSPTSVQPDVLMLEGRDWEFLAEAQRTATHVPRINLVLGVRHGDPSDVRYPFLRHRAVRICNSQPIADVLRSTHQVEGPIFVIPTGLDYTAFPDPLPWHKRPYDLLIVANKRPRRGRLLRLALSRPNRSIKLVTQTTRRPLLLSLMNLAQVTLYLPYPREGFYMPALEGMHLQTVVVCPDCIGNRLHCIPGWNSFRPDDGILDMLFATEAALRLPEDQRKEFWKNGSHMAQQHTIARERQQFLDILSNLDQIW